MINGKKLIVVLPAYNASLTLERTYKEIPFDIVDDVVLVDDRSRDNTAEVAHQIDRKSTRLNSSHIQKSRMPSSA